MSVATALRGDERVSHREVLTLQQVDDARFDILGLTLESLKAQVGALTAGRPVRSQLVYLAFEQVVGLSAPVAPDDDWPYGGVAA